MLIYLSTLFSYIANDVDATSDKSSGQHFVLVEAKRWVLHIHILLQFFHSLSMRHVVKENYHLCFCLIIVNEIQALLNMEPYKEKGKSNRDLHIVF